MKKILIHAPKNIATRLEDKLHHRFDVDVEIDDSNICRIEAKKKNKWIIICRFESSENIKDILTMFEVKYEIKMRSNFTE
ncbi:MAG: hypothetical protein ACPKPY_04980 [Nitrososphaeraceae archaeon]